MNLTFGDQLIWIGGIAATVSWLLYLLTWRGRNLLKQARAAFVFSTLISCVASGLLTYFLIVDDFQVKYVFSHSSRELSTLYKISAFWAGQEGSFLLWLFSAMVFGLIMMRSLKKWEPAFMVIYALEVVALYVMLVKCRLFAITAHTPADGQGLNPLLENFWMAIHPPMMFFGYAASGIPFALAVAAVMRKAEKEWNRMARPWSLVAWVLMGLGIGLGAYWSYETLGWGGYWAWDPVENASLVPWLLLTALLHAHARAARGHRGTLLSYLTAVASFLFVLYGTFLTRSGILANFSVHSFPDLGLSGNLIGIMVLFIAIGVAPLFVRLDVIRDLDAKAKTKKEDFGSQVLLWAILVISLSALMVTLGMSSPLLTSFMENPSQVGIPFYVATNLPLAVLICVLIGIRTLLGKRRDPHWMTAVTIAGSALLTGAGYYWGIRGAAHLLVLFSASWATVRGLIRFGEFAARGHWRLQGIPLAHVGLGVMLLGSLTATGYPWQEKIELPENQVTEVHDHGIQARFVKAFQADHKRWAFQTELTLPDGATYDTYPKMWIEPKSGKRMARPWIIRGFVRDLYIVPVSYEVPRSDESHTVTVQKGGEATISDLKIRFEKFVMPGSHDAQSTMIVEAKLVVEYEGNSYDVSPRYIVLGQGHNDSPWADIGDTSIKVRLIKLDASGGRVILEFDGLPDEDQHDHPPAVFVAEISSKPFIVLVWVGMILLPLGGIWSSVTRFRMAP
jgi:cytochrome c-type biogenesis protein CcmF